MISALGPLRGERLPEAVSLRSGLALAYLALFGSLVAFSAYMYAVGRVRLAVATSYAYVNPVVALALPPPPPQAESAAAETPSAPKPSRVARRVGAASGVLQVGVNRIEVAKRICFIARPAP